MSNHDDFYKGCIIGSCFSIPVSILMWLFRNRTSSNPFYEIKVSERISEQEKTSGSQFEWRDKQQPDKPRAITDEDRKGG